MEASRAGFERAARSANVSPHDPSRESLFSPGPPPEGQEGRDARYSFLCPGCGQLRCHRTSARGFRSEIALDIPECPRCHRRFSSVSNARHNVRHQRSRVCTAHAEHHEVAQIKDLSLPLPPGLEPPGIELSPTELGAAPWNLVVPRFDAEDPVPNLTYALRNLVGIARRHNHEIRSRNYNENKLSKGPHHSEPLRLSKLGPFSVFRTKPEEIEALSIQMFVLEGRGTKQWGLSTTWLVHGERWTCPSDVRKLPIGVTLEETINAGEHVLLQRRWRIRCSSEFQQAKTPATKTADSGERKSRSPGARS